jgi:hypothetical protein
MKTLNSVILLLLVGLCGCQKDFLEKKLNKALLVPTTLVDFQALLDNSGYLMNASPVLPVVAADDYYTTYAGWQSFNIIAERNSYIWSTDIFEGQTSLDWNFAYQQVLYSNVVLDGLQKVASVPANQKDWDCIKGSALFYRALAFYYLTQQFCEGYDVNTVTRAPGIPIRLISDVTIFPGRGTLQQTYMQLLTDLESAKDLLPLKVSYKTRPSKPAAFALLARAYLSMERYEDAGRLADSALQLTNALIDYNTLSTSSLKPFPAPLPNANEEIIFYTTVNSTNFSISSLNYTDPELYQSYAVDDLRKSIFFRDRGDNNFTFKGNYSGSALTLFSGLSTDELYLIRAEASARANHTSAAMTDLNTLLVKRWDNKAVYKTLIADNPEEALKIILTERRKELLFRGLRWSDLRRLNKDPRFAKALNRTLGTEKYHLPANDKRYTFPIPDDEIKRSGIPQN